MIPILYKSTEKDFNHNGLGQMIEMIEATVTEQRNGEFEFYGEYPVSGRLYDSIDDFMFIKAKPNSVDDPHVFRIYEHELDIDTQTVLLYATSKSNDLGSNMVIDVNINDETPLEALNKMKNNLIEPTDYMFYSDINTRSSTKWTRRNPLNCIAGEEGSLLQFWGGEIKRSNTVISLFSRRGKDNVTTIRHGKNLTGLTMNYSTKGMVTLIVPFFTHTPEGKDKEETIIGTHVKSQYINNYPLSYIKEVDYSQDDDVKDLATLNTKASKYFQENTGIDVPTLSATVNIDDLSDSSEYAKFKNLENIELTDTITVYAKKYQVNITAKVNSLTYDVLADKNRELEIGSVRNTFFDDTVRQVKDLVRETKVTLINTIELAANGKNKVFRGVDEPLTGMVLNDLWYKPVGSGEVEMYIFDGAYWQLEAYSGDAIKGTVNFANVNAINLNLNRLTTATVTGANMLLDLQAGSQTFVEPNTGEELILKQGGIVFAKDAQTRHLNYNAEGLQIAPGSENTGTSKNTSITLIGGGTGSNQYLKFLNGGPNWVEQRITALDNNMYIGHGEYGSLRVRTLGGLEDTGKVIAGSFNTSHLSGEVISISGNNIHTPNDGNRDIHLTPNGTGSVIIGTWEGTRWNVKASDFIKQSTRDSKTEIFPVQSKGMDVINRLSPVSYKKKDKLARGIDEVELGFIAEDSPEVATTDLEGIYDSHILTYAVKALQEKDIEIKDLKQEIEEIKKHLGLS